MRMTVTIDIADVELDGRAIDIGRVLAAVARGTLAGTAVATQVADDGRRDCFRLDRRSREAARHWEDVRVPDGGTGGVAYSTVRSTPTRPCRRAASARRGIVIRVASRCSSRATSSSRAARELPGLLPELLPDAGALVPLAEPRSVSLLSSWVGGGLELWCRVGLGSVGWVGSVGLGSVGWVGSWVGVVRWGVGVLGLVVGVGSWVGRVRRGAARAAAPWHRMTKQPRRVAGLSVASGDGAWRVQVSSSVGGSIVTGDAASVRSGNSPSSASYPRASSSARYAAGCR